MLIEAVCGSTQGWWWQWVAQSGNVANAYHMKWLIKCSGQGGERWNLCKKVGQLLIEAVCGSTEWWWWQRVAQSRNMANAYHTKSFADKVWWSRWREVEFMLEGWAIAYRSCLW